MASGALWSRSDPYNLDGLSTMHGSHTRHLSISVMAVHASGCYIYVQVKKELVAVHKVNMANKVARQRTYGALMDGKLVMLMCFDAGDDYTSWNMDMKELRGTFTHSRCACACCAHRGT